MRTAICCALLSSTAVPIAAQGSAVDEHTDAEEELAPPDDRRIGVEITGTYQTEAWNLNGSRERLAGGGVGVWWEFHERLAVLVDLRLIRVFQVTARDAYVLGVMPLLRWQVHDATPWTAFVELGPGVSWSSTEVPLQGTRFNYLALLGAGVTRRVGGSAEVIAGLRWLHISNGGREGGTRNPDLQMLGPYAGVRLAY